MQLVIAYELKSLILSSLKMLVILSHFKYIPGKFQNAIESIFPQLFA